MKIILYHSNPLKFGGVDTFDYNFCKALKNKYHLIFLYKEGNIDTINRIKNLGVQVEKYNDKKIYTCDICLSSSSWGGYPETVYATTGRYIQMIHADYKEAKKTGFIYKKWRKTTEHVAVGQHVYNVFKKLYPKEKIVKIYNLLDDVKDTKPVLKLISATRLSQEKGYNRMLKLARELKKNNVKFRWTIFTDLELYKQERIGMDEIVYMKPSHDLFDYIVEADYGVQLSDTEGYCYFVNECLQYGTPVISTNYPSAYEIVEDGKNGYIVDMDLKNLDIDKIVNNIPVNFNYKEKGTKKDWINLFEKKVRYNQKKYKIVANCNYEDKKPEMIVEGVFEYNDKGNALIKKGNIYYVSDNKRAQEIKKSGLAIVIKM